VAVVVQACTEEVDTLVEQVGTELGQVDTVLEQVCMVVELPPAVVVALVESPLEKSAPLVESVAAAEDLVQVPCLTWVLVEESTCRRQHTSTWVTGVILTRFDQGETSLASSPVAVC